MSRSSPLRTKNNPTIDLAQAFQSISQGIVLVDGNGAVCHWNILAERLFRLKAQEVLHNKISKILPDLADPLTACLRSGQPHQSHLELGNKIPVLILADPISQGGFVVGAVAVCLNLDELQRLSKETASVKNIKDWLDAVIDSSYDGLWICDHEGTVIRVNRASERINQLKAEQVIGRNMQELVTEGMFDKSVAMEVLKKKTSITMIQQLKGGKKILVTGNPIFGDHGEIAYVLNNERDISEMDNLREQLHETQSLAKGYIARLSELEMKGVDLSSVIYRSDEMDRVLRMMLQVADSEATVLILGESGVGKGMIARLIHKNSARNSGPFVRVDCSGVPENLLESELFGYERGAFTGARTEGKAGLFELANNGTLFLDEIGDIPLGAQSKLLRFLEDHEILRVGGTKPKVIDTRVLAATNRNLGEMVRIKQFRKDLYYRIHVVPLFIPPLRKRCEDIVALSLHFLEHYNRTHGRDKVLSLEVIDLLKNFNFPGNVRELQHLVERLVVSVQNQRIGLSDLPKDVVDRISAVPYMEEIPADLSLKEAMRRYEKQLLQGALNKHGSQKLVAKTLKVDRATVSRKMKRYGISEPGLVLHG